MQQRNVRVAMAGTAVCLATALMWLDIVIEIWLNLIEFARRVNSNATASVLDSRPTGDADLHALVWGACAVLIAYALKWENVRLPLGALFLWSLFVELAQPWFTEMRSRQLGDAFGNTAGIVAAVIAIELTQMVRARR